MAKENEALDNEVEDSLTDEEREAMNDDDEESGKEEDSSDDTEKEEELKEEDVEENKDEAIKEEKKQVDTTEGQEEKGELEEEPDGPSIVVPEYPEQPKSDYTISDVKKAITIIDKRHNDGEITDAEWLTGRDRLRDIETQMRIDDAIHKSRIQQSDELASLSWKENQKIFFRQNPEFFDNKTLYAALDGHVRRLALLPDNQDKDYWQILNIAKKIVQKDLNMSPKKSAPSESNEDAEPATDKKKVIDLPKAKKKAPTTLANVPSAEDTPTKGKYTYLENLSGEKLEKEISKLSEDQLDEYLRG
jgi:hypothetical protein